MASRVVFLVVTMLAVAYAMVPHRVRRSRGSEDYDDEKKYTSKYDNVNLDEVLQSDRLLGNYYRCLLDKGTCTPEAKELKQLLPDALLHDCAKCTERQRKGAERVLTFIVVNRPDQWKELETKYDPSGIYRKRYQAEAAKRGIKI